VSSSVILREIIVECEGNQAFKYEFKYSEIYGSRLQEIIYSASGSRINSTKINWGERDVEYTYNFSGIRGHSMFYPGDFNGDGFTDMAVAVNKVDANGNKVKLGGLEIFSKLEVYYSDGSGYNFSSTLLDDLDNYFTMLPGDFNGDGHMDLFTIILDQYPYTNKYFTTGIYFGTSTGFGFTNLNRTYSYNENPKFHVGDFNGDGKSDWVEMYESGSESLVIRTYTSSSSSEKVAESDTYSSSVKKRIIEDFDGDGKSDILLVKENSSQWLGFNEGSADLVVVRDLPFLTSSHHIFPGDLNGDNKCDLLIWDESDGWKLYYFNGMDFEESTSFNAPTITALSSTSVKPPQVFLSDLDSDGKDEIFETKYIAEYIFDDPLYPDIIWVPQYRIHNFENNSFSIATLSLGGIETKSLQFNFGAHLDFNGDGVKDLMFNDWNQTQGRPVVLFKPNSQEKLVTKITNGFNKEAKFEYLPCTNDDVYKKGDGEQLENDVIRISPSIFVVSKLIGPDGTGGDSENWTSYEYHGLKLHKKGKGLLGFEKITVDDIFGNIEIKEFGYNPTHFNTFITKIVTSGSAYPKESNFLNYVHEITHPNGNKSLYPYITWKQDKDIPKDIIITSSFSYDFDNGNVTFKSIDYDGEGRTDIRTEYKNAGRWCKSAPKKATITETRTGKTPITSITEFDYYNGVLSKTIVEPGTSKAVTTVKTPNSLGLPYLITVSAPNEETRVTNYEYDSKYRFIKKIVNPLNFVTEKSYDPKNGNVLTEADILGKTTRYSYDVLGNLKSSTFPDGNSINIEKEWARISSINSVYSVLKSTSGMTPVKKHYNHLGKEVQTETIGFDGATIYSNIEYTKEGFVDKKFGPSLSSKGGDKTEYEYYNDGRIHTITNPIGQTIYSYDARKTTVEDPSNKSVERTTNAHGEIAIVTDNGGSINYYYNSGGQPASIVSPGSATISYGYDSYGNKTSINDPNAGNITYAYDAFGNLKSQADAESNSFTMTYDKLDRLLTKSGPEGTTTYVHDEAENGQGQIASVTGPNNIRQDYEYDEYGRLIKSLENIDGRSFDYLFTYDSYGRPSRTIYPSGFTIINEYANGYLKAVKNSDETLAFWEGIEYNEYGQLVQAKYGNQKTVTNGYDDYNRLNSIDYSGYASFAYVFDQTTGNLRSRTYTKGTTTLSESFIYDNLNRLDKAQIGTNSPYLDMQYNSNGNITYKDDVGDYEYLHPTKPHAVTALMNLPETSVIPDDDQDITYNSFNKASHITEDIHSLEIVYGPDQLRRKTIFSDNSGILMTKFFTDVFEEEITTSGTRKIHYIKGGDGLAAVYIEEPGNTEGDVFYTYTDHLGSIVALADEQGTVSEGNEQSFDPWGRRRNLADWGYTGAATISLIDRGYTGHQHLDQFAIINMNGRMYDPVLGRMLSPDKLIGYPDFSQSFNRYSYGLNNPLSYVDPNGENPLLIVGAVGFLFNYVTYGIENDSWGWDAAGQGVIGAMTAVVGFATSGLGFTTPAAWNYAGNYLLSSAINNLIPPLTIGNGNYNLSISPSFMNGKLGASFTHNFSAGNFHFAMGKNTSDDLYYGISGPGPWGTRLMWGRTDFAGEFAQGVGAIGISGNNWSFRVDNDVRFLGGDKHDRWRSGGFQLTWNDFVFGSRVVTNDTEGDESTIENYTNVKTGEISIPTYKKGTKKNGVLTRGEVWSSPLTFGYKSKYGITAFEWDNARHQQFLQNWVIHSWKGDAYFQAQPFNRYSVKSYRQNPFSIYFY